MKTLFIISFLFVYLSSISIAQEKVEEDIDFAIQNAKKGIYWALSNISNKKSKYEKSIIGEDKLIAKVKVAKELNGVRLESTGYYQTNEVTIILYRSSESLLKDGYVRKGDLETYTEDE